MASTIRYPLLSLSVCERDMLKEALLFSLALLVKSATYILLLQRHLAYSANQPIAPQQLAGVLVKTAYLLHVVCNPD